MKEYTPLDKLISLRDKKALVTGGAMGIGFGIAYRLAEAGAMLTIVDLNAEKGQKAAQDLSESGFETFFIRGDVSQENDVKEIVNSTIKKMGGLDILVNNAGIFPVTPLLQTADADIDRILGVNLKSMVYFAREACRWMIEQKKNGSVINLASIDSLRPSHQGMSIYDASKGAVLALTRSLARELGEYGIRVNAIAPGGVLTEGALFQKSIGGQAGRASLKEFMSRVALGRMGTADDIGRAALFLASELSAYITGSLIVVDGGYLIG
jgi:NAD(P)-dependent dehydrogenase (short-subunit alcohol dehydrogenase family)